MNTLIDDLPQQTLCNIVEAADLLAAVKVEDLTERGEMGMFHLLRDISRAVAHLEENHKFQKEATQ